MTEQSQPETVGILGCGYMGTVAGAAFAERGFHVVGYDIDEAKIERLQQGEVPFHEPGLEELIQGSQAAGRLAFTGNFHDVLRRSTVLYICVGTPPLPDGRPDMAAFQQVTTEIIDSARAGERTGPLLLVVHSTVPVGTARELRKRVTDAGVPVEVVSVPEFLPEGTAVRDALQPHKLVIGGDDAVSVERVARLYRGAVPADRILRTSHEGAELAKLANNVMLFGRVCLLNELARLAEASGVDFDQVARALGLDPRIGSRFLRCGPGCGGSCFLKDLQNVVHSARKQGIPVPIHEAVAESNHQQQRRPGEWLLNCFAGDLTGRRVALLGMAFKQGTDDLRESSSLVLLDQVLAAGGTASVYDPQPSARRELRRRYSDDRVQVVDSIEQAVEGADAAAFMHAAPAEQAGIQELARRMRARVLFDGWRAFDVHEVQQHGFLYFAIGRPPHSPNRDGSRELSTRSVSPGAAMLR